MVKMKFEAKPWKTGNAYVVTIPKVYIDNGYINVSKKLKIEVNKK